MTMNNARPQRITMPSSESEGRVEQALRDLAGGKVVIIIDDASVGAQGSFVSAAESCDEHAVALMRQRGSGVIFVALSRERADALHLPRMAPGDRVRQTQDFTVSVDAKGGISTGIRAADRALTIRLLADQRARRQDFVFPGHVFPLCATAGGVLERAGNSEAAVDRCRLAGIKPVAALTTANGFSNTRVVASPFEGPWRRISRTPWCDGICKSAGAGSQSLKRITRT